MIFSASTISAIVTFVLGGWFSYFRPWLEDQREFKNRGTRILARSAEDIAVSLTDLLRVDARNKGFDNMARGDGVKSPDLYDRFSQAVTRHSKLNFRVSARMIVFRGCYGGLLFGVMIGLIAFIASITTAGYEVAILAVTIPTACLQVGAVVVLYTLTRRSEDDEEIL